MLCVIRFILNKFSNDWNIFIKKDDGTEAIVTFEPGVTGNACTIEEDNFTGNGSTTAFTLSSAPSSKENLYK